MDPDVSNVIDNNGNYSGVDPEYNDESDENDALIPTYNSENSSGDDDDDSDDFIFQENDEDDYLKADAFEYFVTRTDDPDFIPDINGGYNDIDVDNDINGDVVIL